MAVLLLVRWGGVRRKPRSGAGFDVDIVIRRKYDYSTVQAAKRTFTIFARSTFDTSHGQQHQPASNMKLRLALLACVATITLSGMPTYSMLGNQLPNEDHYSGSDM